MSIVVFEHHPNETTAEFGRILRNYGHRLRLVNVHAHGSSFPANLDDVDAVVAMGGSMNVDELDQYPWMETEIAYLRSAHERGVPIVGICLGAQLITKALGGEVERMQKPEVGWQQVKLTFPGTTDPLYAGIGWQTMQFHVHGYETTKLPPGATPLAESMQCKHQAYRVGMTTYAFQYHFEWNYDDLKLTASDDLVARAGTSTDQIIANTHTYYDDYRRLGDRLSDTIATVMFPIFK